MSELVQKAPDVEVSSLIPRWVRSDKVRRIQTLPIFPLVHEWILDGVPETEVARRIQSHGCLTEENISTVCGFVGHYRATVPPAAILTRQRPSDVAKTYKKLTSMTTYLHQLEEMARGQFEEVQKAKRMADESAFPIGTYGGEVERYIKIIQSLLRIRKEAGLTDRQVEEYSAQDPWAFDLDKAYGREGMNELLRDPKSRVKILGTMERLFDMVKAKQDKGEEFSFESMVTKPPESGVQQIDVSTLTAADF